MIKRYHIRTVYGEHFSTTQSDELYSDAEIFEEFMDDLGYSWKDLEKTWIEENIDDIRS